MGLGIRGLFVGALALMGCQDAFVGHAPEGFGTFGSRGGTMYSPDGNFTLEVARGALRDASHLAVGAVDDCLPSEIACYELEPERLELGDGTTAMLDVSSLIEDSFRDRTAPLLIFVHEHWGWRLAKQTDTDADTVWIDLDTLGHVSVVPGTPS